MILFITIAFIFSSGLQESEVEILKLNCPYPIISADVNNVNLNGTEVTYEIVYDENFVNDIFVFNCAGDNLLSVNVAFYNSTSTFFTAFDNAFAWTGYAFFSTQQFFNKVLAVGTLIVSFINAPAEVTGLTFFTYIQVTLISLISIGGYFSIRGVG